MGFHGDLSSVNLSDLLQSLASRKLYGVLLIQTEKKKWEMSIKDGFIVGLNSDSKVPFWSRLVTTGMISEEQLKKAKQKWRKNKVISEIIVNMGIIEKDELRRFFVETIYDQLCNIFNLHMGEITLSENNGFEDKNWNFLDVELPINKIIFESARRTDLWSFATKYIGGPGTILVPAANSQEELDEIDKDNEIVKTLLAKAGPGLTLKEIANSLPYSKADIFQEAANLVKEGYLRVAETEELLQYAEGVEDVDKAMKSLLQAHRKEPANTDILVELIEILKKTGHTKTLGSFLKILANIHIDAGREEKAEPYLREAWNLDPKDPSPGEKLFYVLKNQKKYPEMEQVGFEIMDRFRKLGLNKSWKAVVKELIKHKGSNPELIKQSGLVELALDNKQKAIKLIMEAGRLYLSKDKLKEAESCYRELTDVFPDNTKIKNALSNIQKETLSSKRRTRNRIEAVVCGIIIFVGLIFFGSYEAQARSRFLSITCDILRTKLDSPEQVGKAIEKISNFRKEYKGSLSSFFDAKKIIKELEKKQEDLQNKNLHQAK